jgi:hypothetical protein
MPAALDAAGVLIDAGFFQARNERARDHRIFGVKNLYGPMVKLGSIRCLL